MVVIIVNLDLVKEILDGMEEIKQQLDDPEAIYEIEVAEEHYNNALYAEYLVKDGGEYDDDF